MAKKQPEYIVHTQKGNHDLLFMCHPYLFALKEGHGITNDCLDYSLLLMQRNCAEIIKSPTTQTKGIVFVDSTPMFVRGKLKK